MAHLFDPYLAAHTSSIEPLPHQISAVYQEMLPRLPLRYILAYDPGAGKTIMTGLLLKELIIRGDLEDIVIQFSKELIGPVFNKFGEDTPMMSVNETTCTATVHVQISPTFFGWLAQFGNKMHVISPTNVIEQYKVHINNIFGGNAE